MKKIIFVVLLLATAISPKMYAQDTRVHESEDSIISIYFNIKDALLAGNANAAAANARALTLAAKENNNQTLPAGSLTALVTNATAIAQGIDLKEQRLHFADLSTNMVAIFKAAKRMGQPLYLAYCPMKKAYWLSNSGTIKNPYFGSAMVTCGKIVETIQ